MTQTQTFRFWQNNSGGFWNDIKPVSESVRIDKHSHDVLIEAKTATEANKIAEANGIYFEGVGAGVDCECCGDRWYQVSHPEREDE